MGDTPNLIRLYTDIKTAQMRYEDALKNAGDQDIAEMKEYIEQCGYWLESRQKPSDLLQRARWDRKRSNLWIAFPRRKCTGLDEVLDCLIRHLDARELV